MHGHRHARPSTSISTVHPYLGPRGPVRGGMDARVRPSAHGCRGSCAPLHDGHRDEHRDLPPRRAGDPDGVRSRRDRVPVVLELRGALARRGVQPAARRGGDPGATRSRDRDPRRPVSVPPIAHRVDPSACRREGIRQPHGHAPRVGHRERGLHRDPHDVGSGERADHAHRVSPDDREDRERGAHCRCCAPSSSRSGGTSRSTARRRACGWPRASARAGWSAGPWIICGRPWAPVSVRRRRRTSSWPTCSTTRTARSP